MRRAAALILLACSKTEPPAPTPAPPAIEISDSGAIRAKVAAPGVPDGPLPEPEGRKRLTVTLSGETEPILGSYAASQGVLGFRAAWPGVEGATYVAKAPSGSASASIAARPHPPQGWSARSPTRGRSPRTSSSST